MWHFMAVKVQSANDSIWHQRALDLSQKTTNLLLSWFYSLCSFFDEDEEPSELGMPGSYTRFLGIPDSLVWHV